MSWFKEILPDLWQIKDSCNVFILRDGEEAIAIDFASGGWLKHISEIGIKKLEHVFLTHHHAEQCYGLVQLEKYNFQVHASAEEKDYLDVASQQKGNYSPQGKGCPSSYSVLPQKIPSLQADILPFTSFFWKNRRIRFLSTPGHGAGALSIIIDIAGKQVVFCGDAIYQGGKLWQPYNLDWDHWTGSGALAAWEGIQRLRGIKVGLLCPSHGHNIDKKQAQRELKQLAKRLMQFYVAKGQISKNENDNYVNVEKIADTDIVKISDNLYQLSGNTYFLLSNKANEAFVVDPFRQSIPELKKLLTLLGKDIKISACTVSHYHCDHSEGADILRNEFGTKVYLHEEVARPLSKPDTWMPWLPKTRVRADEILKKTGTFTWNEFKIKYAHWPGQTWNHALFMLKNGSKKIAFSGDSFQPGTLWNGTGGFCSFNNSRFLNGYILSCKLILKWQPDIVAAGHGAIYKYKAGKFKKIIKWAEKTDEIIKKLCLNEDIENYYNIKSATKQKTVEDGVLFWR